MTSAFRGAACCETTDRRVSPAQTTLRNKQQKPRQSFESRASRANQRWLRRRDLNLRVVPTSPRPSLPQHSLPCPRRIQSKAQFTSRRAAQSSVYVREEEPVLN